MFELTAVHIVLLPLLGVAVSALGTMVGLGGGFILVPLLLFLYPEATPSVISIISLTVVLINASSATIGNMRAGRVDGKTALLLAVTSIPAAVLGAIAAANVSRERFEVLFGIMLLVGALYVGWRCLNDMKIVVFVNFV
jgi:uncharacterized membrane protein YfcA